MQGNDEDRTQPLTPPEIGAYYDKVASAFHTNRLHDGRLFNEHIEMPAALELIGAIGSRTSVLDIGCGSGLYAKLLGQKGAAVTGVDVSARMLDIASDYCRDLTGVTFRNVSFEEADFGSQTFSVVLGSFMLGYFPDLQSAFSKMRALLVEGGHIVVSMLHPVRLSATARDAHSYLVTDYFSRKLYRAVIVEGEETIPILKYTVSDVSDSAWKSGLVIERLLEPVPNIPPVDGRMEFYHRCPSVLAARLRPR